MPTEPPRWKPSPAVWVLGIVSWIGIVVFFALLTGVINDIKAFFR